MSEQARRRVSIDEAIFTNLLKTVRPQVTDLHGRSWEEIEAAVRDRMTTLTEKNKTRMIDAPSRQWVLVARVYMGSGLEI